jgi:uncharacterized protein (UPF0371 family)
VADFDNEKYVSLQTQKIRERISALGDKLYLEFGGKLFDDLHAARVLPGYDPNCKIKLMLAMKDITEIIMCVSAVALEKNKIRADFGITYDADAIRLIGKLKRLNIEINSVVITQYQGQLTADIFKRKLTNMGYRVYLHCPTKGYPTEVDTVISREGYGANPYIETTKPLIIVCAPGPGSGKLATALSQLYHESVQGKKAGYAKFETFPIWSLPLKHPINLAYEAATADLKDVNMIDPYHLEAYGTSTVSYNRDIEVFPIVKAILEKITGKNVYKSPTDMGVNMAGFAILDDEACREAAKQEIIRRYFKARCDFKQGVAEADIPGRIEVIMRQIELKPEDRKVVTPARELSSAINTPVTAIELPGGRIITGKQSALMSSPCAAIINAVKTLACIDDHIHLLSPEVLEPITGMKKDILKTETQRLGVEEMLIAMSICAPSDFVVERAYRTLPSLAGCEAHSTVMLTAGDVSALRKMGINLTCDPEYIANELFFSAV